MNKLYLVLVLIFLGTTSCEKLDQFPPNIASSGSLTDYEGVLNAAYYYQHASATPMAVMGDFRSDNAFMDEAPYDDFDKFDANLTSMDDQFFGPLYSGLYKSILSANNVIENSGDATEVGEARFLRGLAYYKLVTVFGPVTINLSDVPDAADRTILERKPVDQVYNEVIVPDFEAAIAALGTSSNGRASKMAAKGLLGKAYAQIRDYSKAATLLGEVVNGAAAAGYELQADFSTVFGAAFDLNSEILVMVRWT